MNNNEQAMAKLAQVRMAINHVLRTRAMQKQAERPLFDFKGLTNPRYQRRWHKLDPENAGTIAGATYDKDMTRMTMKEPEKGNYTSFFRTPWWGFPIMNTINDIADKTQRMQNSRDPKKIEEAKQWEQPH